MKCRTLMQRAASELTKAFAFKKIASWAMNIYLECIFKEETYKENAAFKTLILPGAILLIIVSVYWKLSCILHKIHTCVQAAGFTKEMHLLEDIKLKCRTLMWKRACQAGVLGFKHQDPRKRCICSRKANSISESWCKVLLTSLLES